MARLVAFPGGEGPVNDGERRVVQAFVESLPQDFVVLPNVSIREREGQSFEYDAIVTAPHGVYAVEIKDWRGSIRGDDREWVVNGASRRSPLLAIDRKARVLKSKLVQHQEVLARVWVQGLVVLASQPAELVLSGDSKERTLQLDEAIAYLQNPAGVRQRAAAIADLIPAVLEALGGTVSPRADPQLIGAYRVLEVLEQTEDEVTYRARHRDMPASPTVRIRVVGLSPYSLTEQERKERKGRLYRELEALLQMGSHPNIITAREVFEDDLGRVVLVHDNLEVRSLRAKLQDGTPLTVEERVDLLVGVTRGLAHAHSHGVIHRRLEPINILIDDHGTPKISSFGFAKLDIPGAATVWDDEVLSSADVRFIPPELYNGQLGEASAATDLYGLGCIAYELFAGEPPFAEPRKAFDGPPAVPNSMPPALGELTGKLLIADPLLRPKDSKDVLAVLESIRGSGLSRAGTGPKATYEPGDVIDGKFEVRGVLGKGGFSSVYRVYRALDDREYALKVFNAGDAYEKVQREVNVLRSIDHPNVVRVVWADRTQAGQWYLVSDIVSGESLEAYCQEGKKLPVDDAVQAVEELLAALESIHPDQKRIEELEGKEELSGDEYWELQELKSSGIVHRDIKPQNLMLTSTGVVLIDFNIASRVGDQVVTLSGTPRYQAPDVDLTTWDVSPDLFATGVVLFELVCGHHPFEQEQPRIDRLPRDPRKYVPSLNPEFAEMLVRACAPLRADRFQSASEMRSALVEVSPYVLERQEVSTNGLPPRLAELLREHPPNVNPMVREFLALSSQARRTNRATRGLDDVAEATYVETRLDVDLMDSLLGGEHRLVLITGNAGDGKTAFIQQAEALAKERGAQVIDVTPNGSHLIYAGKTIRTLYDGSQDQEDRTSDEVLRAFFGPFTGNSNDEIGLAAINEGRFRDFILSFRQEFPFLLGLLEQLDHPMGTLPKRDFVVVNLNFRSVTAGGPDSIFSRQIEAIVKGPFWDPCQECDYRVRCPLKHNVDTLRDTSSGPTTIERLRQLIDLVRLRRRRHLTMRDVRSLISFVLFRDRTCEEIPAILDSDDPFDVLDLAYFQAIAGQGVPDGSIVDRSAQLLDEVDVGIVANPADDRAIAGGRGPRVMSFPTRESSYPLELIAKAREGAGIGYGGDPLLNRRVHEAARRLFFFERSDEGWWDMLPYRELRTFESALADEADSLRTELGESVIGALSTAEGVSDYASAKSALWVATNELDSAHFASFRRFPAIEFELRVVHPQVPYVEVEPDHLELVHLPSDAALVLDLDLLEVLERLRDGYVPSIEEGQGLLINLALFKNRLLALPTSELLINFDDEILRVESGEGGVVALREGAS